MATGDLNSDGRDDLALLRGSGQSTDHVAVFYQQDHALAAPVYLTVETGGFQAHGLAVGDVNDDGRDDIVVTAGGNTPHAYLNVFHQQTDGSMVKALHSPYTAYHLPEAVEIGDVTGDGALDALIASHSSLSSDNGLVVVPNATPSAPTSSITNPALATYITSTIAISYPIQGTASAGTASLKVSTNGGQSWYAALGTTNWTYDWTVPQDGSYIILSRATDAAGHVQSLPARTRAIVDRTSPTVTMVIDDDALYTTIPTVTLTITATDYNGIDAMRFTNQGGSYTEWQSPVVTRTWELSGTDGKKTVLAQVRDVPGNITTISDTIILDQTPPTVTMVINNDAPYTTIPTVTLTITATDTNGIDAMRFANQSGSYTEWQSPVITRTWELSGSDGLKTVLVQVRDVPGNAATVGDAITLDRVRPTGGVVINNDDLRTESLTVSSP